MTTEINGKPYMQDSRGRLVPAANVPELDKLRDELTCELVREADEMSRAVSKFMAAATAKLDSFRELSAQDHGAAVGGKRGGFSIQSYDGQMRVIYDVDAVITFNEKVGLAHETVLRLVDQWAAAAGEANAKLASLVRSAFEVDKNGHLSVARILQLRRVKIDDAEWAKAMEALDDGIETNQTKLYVRFYRKNSQGAWEQISTGR
jgi:uncharacterized protein (DUF1778 family)